MTDSLWHRMENLVRAGAVFVAANILLLFAAGLGGNLLCCAAMGLLVIAYLAFFYLLVVGKFSLLLKFWIFLPMALYTALIVYSVHDFLNSVD